MKIYNLTQKDIFNSNTGTPIKEAGEQHRKVTIIGAAVSTELNVSTGEETALSVIKTSDGEIIAGKSTVMYGRVSQLMEIFSEEDFKKGIDVEFITFRAGRGTGISINLV